LAELAELLSFGIPLICDEVFASYVQPGVSGCSGWEVQSEGLVFTLDGLSKWAGLPQCKLAWTVVSGEKRKVEAALRQLEFVADAYLSANGLVQAALPTLLECAGRTQSSIAARVFDNLRLIDAELAGSPCTRLHSEGGWTALLQLPNTLDEEAWVSRLLDVGVGVQPGWFYDINRAPTIVLSLLTHPEQLKAAVSRIDTLVSL
jgi:alanine-synthesizing transaminase